MTGRVNLRTLGRNSLVAALAEMWRVISRFILTPIIFAYVGLEGYGVWTLVFALAEYVSMTNVSFGLAYTKFTAECVHRDEFDRLAKIIGSGMVGIGSVAIVGLAVAIGTGHWLFAEVLKVPPELVDDAATTLHIVVAVLCLRMSVGCCYEILSGLQRMDLMSRVTILASIIEVGVAIPLLHFGYGLVALGIAFAAGQTISILTAYVLVRRTEPRIVISPARLSREGFVLMLSVGGKFQLLTVVNTIVMQGVKFLISSLVGVRWVGVYGLADKLLMLGRSASSALVAPLMPAFADLHASQDTSRERKLFFKGSKADGLVGGGSFIFLGLFVHPLILAWTGESVPEAGWALQVMATGEALFVLTSVVSASLRARGLVAIEFKAALIGTGVFVAGVIALSRWYEFEAVVYARLIAQAFAALWYTQAYLSFAKIPMREYLVGTRMAWVILGHAMTAAVTFAASRLIELPQIPGLDARWNAVVVVAVWAVPYAAMLTFFAWRLAFDDEDRGKVREIVARVRAKLGRR